MDKVRALIARDAVKQALELVDQELKRTPEHAGLHRLKGAIFGYAGDPNRALAAFQQALKLAPDYIEAHLDAIRAQIMLRRPLDAFDACNVLIARHPNLAPAFHLRGVTYADQNKFAQARAEFEAAIRLQANGRCAGLSLGLLELEADDLDKAIRNLDRAIGLDDRLASAYAWRGEIYLRKGEEGRASEDFKHALSINRGEWIARRGLQGLQMMRALEQMGHIRKRGT